VSRPIPDDAAIVAAERQLSTSFGSEVVILGLDDSTYYGLSEVGARVWHLLQERTTLPALVDAIAAQYDVERGRADTDVRALVGQLVERGLVTVDGGDRA
jgi:hypothetical protein